VFWYGARYPTPRLGDAAALEQVEGDAAGQRAADDDGGDRTGTGGGQDWRDRRRCRSGSWRRCGSRCRLYDRCRRGSRSRCRCRCRLLGCGLGRDRSGSRDGVGCFDGIATGGQDGVIELSVALEDDEGVEPVAAEGDAWRTGVEGDTAAGDLGAASDVLAASGQGVLGDDLTADQDVTGLGDAAGDGMCTEVVDVALVDAEVGVDGADAGILTILVLQLGSVHGATVDDGVGVAVTCRVEVDAGGLSGLGDHQRGADDEAAEQTGFE